jgi:hypothetical protein
MRTSIAFAVLLALPCGVRAQSDPEAAIKRMYAKTLDEMQKATTAGAARNALWGAGARLVDSHERWLATEDARENLPGPDSGDRWEIGGVSALAPRIWPLG